uniref:Uncharacterized protein n=1 Tax=Dulem virus 240 TaxID=3145717 RepID=A0AAU8B839_9VIRU
MKKGNDKNCNSGTRYFIAMRANVDGDVIVGFSPIFDDAHRDEVFKEYKEMVYDSEIPDSIESIVLFRFADEYLRRDSAYHRAGCENVSIAEILDILSSRLS